jgi:hypothetical protein
MIRDALELAMELQAIAIGQAADGGVQAVVAQALGLKSLQAAIIEHVRQYPGDLARRLAGGNIALRLAAFLFGDRGLFHLRHLAQCDALAYPGLDFGQNKPHGRTARLAVAQWYRPRKSWIVFEALVNGGPSETGNSLKVWHADQGDCRVEA